ncbi:MAG: translation elongation factor Ts [Patescibacteria group bacterium]
MSQQLDTQKIKELRELSGAGINNCKEALKEANNNLSQALEILRKKGQKIAFNKQARPTKEGVVGVYVHSNQKLGVLVEVLCETDFVARTDDFKNFVHDIAMQIAASNPSWVSPGEAPIEIVEQEKRIYREELKNDKKPEEVKEKIIDGKLEKFFSETCLLKQIFIKDQTITIEQLLTGKIAAIGENIKIQRFTRYSLS